VKHSEVMHRAQLVGGQVHLGGVRLVESAARMSPDASYDVRHRVSTDINATAIVDAELLQAHVRYAVEAYAEDGDALAFRIEMLWILDYAVPEESPLTQLDAEAFAVISGVMAAHPYAREHVQRMSSHMGFDPLVLDVWRQGAQDEDREIPLLAEAEADEDH
jgi:preprotein translocase subunit SecB